MTDKGVMAMLSSITVTECLQALRNNKWKALGYAAATLLGSLLMHNLSIRTYRRLNGIPPSPIPMPLIGLSLYYKWLMMGKKDENGETKDIFLTIHATSSDIGDIQQFYHSPFGSMPFITVANSRLWRKIMEKNVELATSHYVIPGGVHGKKDGEESLVQLNGQAWKERRKLFVSVFTKMLTTKFMNKVCRAAIVNVLFPEIDATCVEQGQPLAIREQMQFLAFQAVFYANFNRFFSKDDEFLREFRDAMQLATDQAAEPANIWKQMEGLPLGAEVHEARDNLSRLTQQIMAQRRKELKAQMGLDFTNPGKDAKTHNEEQKDDDAMAELIKGVEFDSYLDYLLKLVHEGVISDAVAEVEVHGVFTNAWLNVAYALEWAVVLCAKFASTQKRIRQELYRVHGVDGKAAPAGKVLDFDLNKANQCALLRAFVHETLRYQPFTRNGPLRQIARDLQIEWNGARYVLPKGALVGYQVEFMQRLSCNEKRRGGDAGGAALDGWLRDDRPMSIAPFNVENWLDEQGRFRMNRALCGFGYGRRDCPGKAFAIKSMLINLGYLIMNYNIEFGDEDKRKAPEQVHVRASVEEFFRKVEPEVSVLFSKIE